MCHGSCILSYNIKMKISTTTSAESASICIVFDILPSARRVLEEDELRVEEALGEVLEVLELLRVEEAGALALLVEEVLRVEVLALREEAAGAEVERVKVALELRVVVVTPDVG